MIGLSPLSTGHPLRFQPKWVRPSTGSYPRFSLPMDRSPGFASTTYDYDAILKARFHCGSVLALTSPPTATRWLILQKARRHTVKVLRLLVDARFQVLFHSPLGVHAGLISMPCPLRAFTGTSRTPPGCPSPSPLRSIAARERRWNVCQLRIGCASRPRLSSRLTLG